MRIDSYEPDQALACEYQGHHFELFRDPEEGPRFDHWYMIVKDAAGSYCCDGWVEGDEELTMVEALIAACEGAELAPPSEFPKELTEIA